MKRRLFSKKVLAGMAVGGFSTSVFSHPTPLETPKKRLKVKRLQKGDTIGLIAPGSPVTEKKFEKALSNLENFGFKVYHTDNILARHGYLAGTDEQRLNDLHQMFADPKIDGIWCIRGGYGCGRLLPKIDYSIIRKNPKALIGYSDVTALLQAIYLKTGLIGFHGPVAVSEMTDYTKTHFRSIVMETNPRFIINPSEGNLNHEDRLYKTKVLRSGKAEGQLIGGNLSLISALAGTKYQWKIKDKVLFMEDVGEKPYRVDRMLTQLIQSCDLNKAAGIALGIFAGCEKKEDDQSLSLMETLEDRLGGLNIPVIYGLSFGHIDDQCTLPIGIRAELDTSKQSLTLLEPATQ